MFRHYLLNASRNLLRNPLYTLINLGGLAIGLAACIFILLWVRDELSFDRYFPESDRTYRIVYKDNVWTQPRTPHPMPLAMKNDFPGVESGISLSPIWGMGLTRPEHTVRYLDRRFEEPAFLSADSTFFQVFPFPFLEGNPAEALKIPNGLVITRSSARKYFGSEPALGKVLEIDGRVNLTVTGVCVDVPHNTHFTFDFLVSYVTMKATDRADHQGELSDYYTWNDFGHFNYVVLAPGTDPRKIEDGIIHWLANYIDFTPEQMEEIERNNVHLVLQPLTDIHLHSHMVWELGNNGNIVYVYAFSITALLILVIAILNFMNLSTARTEKRVKEASVRKTLGAFRRQLILQFMLESIILTLLSVILAVFLVELLLPAFAGFTGKDYGWQLTNWGLNTGVLLLVTCAVGFLSGVYPSMYFTSFMPLHFLKGHAGSDLTQVRLRKILVVIQFAISIFLLISTLGIKDQLRYIRDRDLGFNNQNILVVPLRSDHVRNQFQSFREALLQDPGVENVSGVSNIPGKEFNNNDIYWKDPQKYLNAAEVWVDDEFFSLMDINVRVGRTFSGEFSADSVASFILNETACKGLNMTDPVGEKITWEGDSPGTVHGKVIGVVGDFNFRSLHDEIAPLIIQRVSDNGQMQYLLIRLTGNDLSRTIRYIGKTWTKFESVQGFKYSFLNDDFAALYDAEAKMASIFRIFTLLGILIACLGMIGLSSFMAELRTKEIGIRKAHGSTSGQIFGMLIREAVVQVLVASLIAWPLTWILLHRWLQNYAYHASVNPLYFLMATLTGALIAILVTAYQGLRAASRNPVEALRYE